MRKVLILVVLAAAILVGLWLMLGTQPPAGSPLAQDRQSVTQAAQREPSPGRSRVDADERTRRIREQSVERAALRQRITEAMQARELAAAANGRGATAEDDPRAAPARARRAGNPAVAEEAPGAPPLLDRTGNHAYLTRVLSEQLMPLAEECYELARVKQPELGGELVLEFAILGDEDVGGVIDSVAPGPRNEIVDPGLLECISESLLATSLPPPEQGGRDEVSLNMRFAPDDVE